MPSRLLAFALVIGAACGDAPAPGDAATAPPSEVERAQAMLVAGSPWPSNEEVVALSATLSLAASKEASRDEQARLYRLAADLRVRAFRFDRTEADARAGMDLLQQVARAVRGKEAACDAERLRATIAGELAHDAHVAHRELYLARRRNAELAADGKTSECLTGIDRALSLAVAYRPSGEELAALERDGDRAEQAARVAQPSALPSLASVPIPSAAAFTDVVVSPSALAPSKEPVKITKIDKYGAEGGGRVVVHVSGPTSFHVGALAAEAGKDPRIFVDIDRASVKGVAREIEVGGAIKRVRTAPREGGSRIVLDLSADLHRRVFYLPEPFRVVIDISSRKPEPAKGSATGPQKIKRVAIDPGHGGHDAGAVGPTGLKEKDVTLAIAHLVAPVLASELQIETLLTRDADVFVPLDERTARANAFHADLFVSVHCNASETGEARGIEVFILDDVKDQNRATARIAAIENGLGKSALDAGALDAEMASIASRLGSGEIASSSRRLGVLLGKATIASLSQRYPNTADHGLKSAGFYVLAGAEMPAVLFETSFISNPDDEGRLAKADYKQKLADGIVNAIKAYREGK